MNKKEIAQKVVDLLKKHHPNPVTELNYKNEFELFVAVCLSAQTTDIRVNKVTPALFNKYKSFSELASAKQEQLEELIKSVNFYKGKAKRLIEGSKFIVENYGGKLPKKINDLIKIPGIARKSANVIQQELWGIAEGIVVDTHVARVSNRLGLTTSSNAVKIERDLMALINSEDYRIFSGGIVLHGRYVCKAKKPECSKCIFSNFCPSAFKF